MRNWGKQSNEMPQVISPNEWHIYFTDLYNENLTPQEQIKTKLKILEKQPMFTHLDFRIQDHEINQAFKKLSQNASPEIDKISGKTLYAGKQLLLNKTFSEANHPSSWSLNFLKTIHKNYTSKTIHQKLYIKNYTSKTIHQKLYIKNYTSKTIHKNYT